MKLLLSLVAIVASYVMFAVVVGLRVFGPSLQYEIEWQVFLLSMAYIVGMSGSIYALHVYARKHLRDEAWHIKGGVNPPATEPKPRTGPAGQGIRLA